MYMECPGHPYLSESTDSMILYNNIMHASQYIHNSLALANHCCQLSVAINNYVCVCVCVRTCVCVCVCVCDISLFTATTNTLLITMVSYHYYDPGVSTRIHALYIPNLVCCG